MESTLQNKTGREAGRIVWIDIAKAAAAWMVVTSHLLRQGMLTDYLAAVSVAAFYILAGMTLRRYDSYAAYSWGRLRRIMLPYLFVGLVSIVMYRMLGSYAASHLGVALPETSAIEDLWHLLYGSSVNGLMKWNEPLWFLPCYCLSMMLAQHIERIGTGHRLRQGLLYLLGGLVGYGFIAAGITGLPWHLETALFLLPLIGCGRWLRGELQEDARGGRQAGLVGAALLAVGAVLFTVAESQAQEGAFSLRAIHLGGLWESYGFLLASAAGILLLVRALCSMGTMRMLAEGPVLPYVGAHSLDIVLWNKFPVLAAQVLLPLVLPGITARFVGRSDAQALLIATLLALPCMGLCLVWTFLYQSFFARLRR